MYGLSLVANPQKWETVKAGVQFKTGVLNAPLTVQLRNKQRIELPAGSGVRFYKGTFGPGELEGLTTPKKLSSGHYRWFVEATPPSGQAWFVYEKHQGLPGSYATTWNPKGGLGWKRFGIAWEGPDTSKRIGGYPDAFLKSKPSPEVSSDTKIGKDPLLQEGPGAAVKSFSDSYGDLEKIIGKDGQSEDPLAEGTGSGKGGGSPGGIIPGVQIPGLRLGKTNIFIPWLVVAGAGVGLALSAPLGLALIGAGLIQDARS